MSSQKNHPAHIDNGHGNLFLIPFLLIVVYAIVEFAGAIWTQSLALLGDAWHMFSDSLSLCLAMLAVYRAKVKVKSNAELIASIINVILMYGVITWMIIEAIERISQPRDVIGSYVIAIAFVGLVVNVIVVKQLHQGEEEKNLNHQAALLHVIGDLLGSVAALAAGLIIYATDWVLVDPLLSLFISLLLLIATLNLSKQVWLALSGKEVSQSHHH
ncbi:MAG TPA: cation diffusion facilitator family transporter [Methylophilaceae bacterium]|nr:cation diffusion facilitator family transporter [Methylophilaceae bacterium]